MQSAPSGRFGSHNATSHQAVVAQPESAAQLVLQLVPEQMNGLQTCDCSGGQLAEEPLQLAAKVAVPLAQLAARHWVLLSRNRFEGQVALAPVHVS